MVCGAARPSRGVTRPPSGHAPALCTCRQLDPMLTSIACKCVEAKTPTADLDLDTQDYYCRGIDAIDGRLIGCCNLVTNTR